MVRVVTHENPGAEIEELRPDITPKRTKPRVEIRNPNSGEVPTPSAGSATWQDDGAVSAFLPRSDALPPPGRASFCNAATNSGIRIIRIRHVARRSTRRRCPEAAIDP